MFVRWSNLTLEPGEGSPAPLPGYRDAVARHFDVPEAMGIRFYEVRARSILNRVPESSAVPFRWTINPYRGCTHACAYCLGGETPVRMADGSERPLADLVVGDRIAGTAGRVPVATEVLAHWSTVKPAYRVALADGGELVASADHRLLTSEGWRKVARIGSGTRLCGPEGGETEVRSVRAVAGQLRLYDITTGTGDFVAHGIVAHNCFARPTHEYLGFGAGRDFEREIVVKVNAPELARAELGRPAWGREHVALGTNTDPYQWVEGRYRLMPGIWEALADARNPCSVLTKSPLLLRDLALFRRLVARTEFTACLSVPTLAEKAWRATEPHTPHPRARLEAVAELNRAGVPAGILIAPLMPGINDGPAEVEAILAAASEAGATSVGGIGLHLRGATRRVFMDWLRDARPDLVSHYEALYARGAYLPAGERRRLGALAYGEGTRFGELPRSGFSRRAEAEATPPRPAPVQPPLWVLDA